jgi:hypothetical protein
MIKNGGMEGITRPGGWTRDTFNGQEYGEIFVPEGWVAFWKEGLPVPHDPQNTVGYGRPEMQVIQKVPPFLNPPRIRSGDWSLKYFTFYRIHDAGIYQTVTVPNNARLRASFWAHAWSSQLDDPFHSDQTTEDDRQNFTFTIGIDPTGGTDPWADSVEWGEGAHIYDTFAQVPLVEVVAQGTQVTVFIRSQVLWPFKHCDAYADDVTLEIVNEPLECPQAREPYERTYALIPPGHDAEWATVLKPAINTYKTTVGFSADDAFIYVTGMGKRVVLALNPTAWNGDLAAFWQEWYPATADSLVEYVPITAATPQEWLEGVLAYYEGGEPNPNPGGYDYPVLAFGSKLYPHAVGEGGTFDMLQYLYSNGHTLPYVKMALAKEQDLVQTTNLQALSPGTQFIIRMQTIGGSHYIETPNFRTDSAAIYMGQILPLMAAYPQVAYWELWNEIDPGDTAGHVALANFACDCIDIADAHGVKLALMSYSTGMPEPEEWQAIFTQTQLFQKAKAGGHILSLHAYGSVNNPGDLTYHILRPLYQLYEPILIPADNVISYVLTEWNINNGPLPIEQWLLELSGIDDLLAEQYFCLGIAIFTFGAAQSWPTFDMTSLWQPVASLIYDTRHRENALPPAVEPEPSNVIAYSQRDPLWAAKRLLPSYATMGGSGCLVTSIAMKATEYDQGVTPGNLCDCLCANGGFNSDGGLLFYQVDDCLPWLQFRGYTLWADTANMAMVEAALARGSTIVKVDFYPSTEPIDSHFVYVSGWTDAGHTDLAIIDPWTGERTTLMTKYPRATLAASIKGLVDYEIVLTASTTLIGFNDCDGPNGSASQWMMEH